MVSGADLGLFGPESMTWRIHADPVLWVAGVRALTLQALHPRAMAAVHQFSAFHDDFWGRLTRTADYVGVISYGTTAEAHEAARRVRALHARLQAIDEETGERFPVDDPRLLLWIHCCEVDSFLTTVRRAGVAVSDAEADRYVLEQVRAARLVGLGPEHDVPRTVVELARYFDRMRPELHATPAAREGARFMVLAPMPIWVQVATPARLGWAGVCGLGMALLPRWARRMYGLPGLPTTDVSATLALRALHAALAAVPAGLREGPRMKEAQQRVAASSVHRIEAFEVP